MKHNWKIRKLANILSQYREEIWVDELKEYSQITNSKHNGITLRGKKMGSEIGRKRQFVINLNKYPNTITFTRQTIQADEAIGLCPKEVNSCIVTENMPLFSVVDAEPRFIEYFFRTRLFLNQLHKTSALGTSQQSIHENIFLNYEIPLPPLPEQQRIVAKIENIKNRIEEIQRLRAEQIKEIYFLRNSIFIELQNEFENVPIGKFIVRNENIVKLDPDGDYKQVTVKMEHKGVLLRGMMKGSEIGSKQYLANEGDFIISKIDARNGAMGFIPGDLEGAIVTGDFPLYNFSKEINPKFFYYFSNTLYFDNECKNASEGTTNRKRLKLGRFESILIPCPPRKEQNRIVALLDKLNELTTTHSETEKELSQLMPSLLDKAFEGEL